MIRWWEHIEKGGRDGRRDGQTDNTICRAAWSQLKTYRLKTFADLRRRWRSCVTRIGRTAAADAPVGSCIQLSHLYASVPPVYFCCSWISWSSRNFRQRSWLHCDSYWSHLFPSNCIKCIDSKLDIFLVLLFWFTYYSSWTSLCELLWPHIQWGGVCVSTKYTMPTLGFATSSHSRAYRSIYVPRSHISRCCKLLPGAKWKRVTVVLHDVSWAALGLLWFRDDKTRLLACKAVLQGCCTWMDYKF